jgi:hypothetical protein
MLKLKKMAVLLALAGGASSANAALITNADGSFDFGGFDWASNGSIWVQNYGVLQGSNTTGDTDNFTLTYMANAAAVQNAGGTNYSSLVMPGLNNSYEYTIFAQVNETVVCLNANCSLAEISVGNGSTWNVYYDTSSNANMATGLGVTDGTLLLSGTFAASPISQSFVAPQGTSNPGNVSLIAALQGSVLTTNTTYINPILNGSTAVSTLQFGNTTTAWTRPTSFNGTSTGANTNSDFVGQADANQSFAANVVPEPGTLTLIGLGLGMAGLIRRRRSSANS